MYLFLTNWLSWFLHDANKILSFSLCLFNDLQFLSCVVAFSSLASSTYCFNVFVGVINDEQKKPRKQWEEMSKYSFVIKLRYQKLTHHNTMPTHMKRIYFHE